MQCEKQTHDHADDSKCFTLRLIPSNNRCAVELRSLHETRASSVKTPLLLHSVVSKVV